MTKWIVKTLNRHTLEEVLETEECESCSKAIEYKHYLEENLSAYGLSVDVEIIVEKV